MVKVSVIVSDEVSHLVTFDTKRLRRYAQDVLKSSGVVSGDVNVIVISDTIMISLNKKYKKRKGTTDVLSFRLSEEQANNIEGEVYVSLEQAYRQATEYDVPYEEEVIRLVTHGLLHLTGRDHNSEEEYTSIMNDTDRLVQLYFHQ